MQWVLVVAVVAMSSATLLGCEAAATQLIVLVDTDFSVPGEMARIGTTVRNAAGAEVTAQSFALAGRDVEPGPAQFVIPISFGIVPVGGDARRLVTVDVQGIDGADVPLVSRRAITGFIEGQTLLLPMYLTRACVAVVCPAGQTCTERGCVNEIIPPSELPRIRPGDEIHRFDGGYPRDTEVLRDAGNDGGADAGRDAAVDAGPDAGTDAGPDAGPRPDSGGECESACPDGCEPLACGTRECLCENTCGCLISCSMPSACQPRCVQDCAIAASGTTDLDATCSVGRSCSIDAHESSGARVHCASNSDCTVNCRQSMGCRLDCQAANSDCLLDCAGAIDCAYSRCIGPITPCGGQRWACGRACP